MNVILAFVLVKFIIYPGLGFLLGTAYPVVAVVSSSMEHNGLGFDGWWEANKGWYEQNSVEKEVLASTFRNGFNKGDIMILIGAPPKKLKKGDVLVYQNERYKYPIIHRITKIDKYDGKLIFQTKGDNNRQADPLQIKEEKIVGKAVFRVPWLGWVKLIFTKAIGGI